MITATQKVINGNDYVVVEFKRDGLETMVHETTTPELIMLKNYENKLTRRQLSLINRELIYRNSIVGGRRNNE